MVKINTYPIFVKIGVVMALEICLSFGLAGSFAQKTSKRLVKAAAD